jgi:hypothetical protein
MNSVMGIHMGNRKGSQPGKKQVYKVFIGGGGDDWISGIVEDYVALYATANATVHSEYFSWTESIDIKNYILQEIPPAAHITIIGHSYGADSAFTFLRKGRTANVLISIDPVGRFKTPWTTIRNSAINWLNVNATPSDKTWSQGDVVAWAGSKYGPPPAKGKPGAPDYSYSADLTHADFRRMMAVGAVSGRSLLGGKYV